MTIFEARQNHLNAKDILSMDMSDEEKLVYWFENNKERVRAFSSVLYYTCLALADKYKTPPNDYFESPPN